MEQICLDKSQLKELVTEVTDHVMARYGIMDGPWVSKDEAMKLLRIESSATLHKLLQVV